MQRGMASGGSSGTGLQFFFQTFVIRTRINSSLVGLRVFRYLKTFLVLPLIDIGTLLTFSENQLGDY